MILAIIFYYPVYTVQRLIILKPKQFISTIQDIICVNLSMRDYSDPQEQENRATLPYKRDENRDNRK